MKTKFDPQTSPHVDLLTGQVTSGGVARGRRIAEAGGLDKVQKKAYDEGYFDGNADGYRDGFEEGRQFGAEEAYKRVEERLKRIEEAILTATP